MNNLSDKITVLHSPIEDVILPEPADVLVSEWMGFYLLHESMLASVLSARDRLLRPGGIMLPQTARLLCSPVDLTKYLEDKIGFWADVYG